jgi:hypothetical protein
MGLGRASTSAHAPEDARSRIVIAAGSVKRTMQRKNLVGTVMAILPLSAESLIRSVS